MYKHLFFLDPNGSRPFVCHLSNISRHIARNKQCKIVVHFTYRTFVYAHDELTLSSRSGMCREFTLYVLMSL